MNLESFHSIKTLELKGKRMRIRYKQDEGIYFVIMSTEELHGDPDQGSEVSLEKISCSVIIATDLGISELDRFQQDSS